MDCGYFGVSPITGTFTYWPPKLPPTSEVIKKEERKVIKGFAQYRSIEEPFEVSKEEK